MREVWNGGLLIEATVKSDKPPLQACPASLAILECSDDRPLWISTRDGRVFFDQLRLPLTLVPCMGRPYVVIADFINPPSCESAGPSAKGLSIEELRGLILDSGVVDEVDGFIAPVTKCWPMDFGW